MILRLGNVTHSAGKYSQEQMPINALVKCLKGNSVTRKEYVYPKKFRDICGVSPFFPNIYKLWMYKVSRICIMIIQRN